MTDTAPSDWWSTAISDIEPGRIHYRGYGVGDLIGEVSFAQMVWLLLRGDLPTPGQAHLLERALVAGVDHGPQAPSIAIARMAATCGVGINSAVASAINTLGDVHGGAGQQLMEVMEPLAGLDGDALRDACQEIVDDLRARKSYLPGFGHRFHPVDPRRDPLLAQVRTAIDAGEVEGRYLAVGLQLEECLNAGRARPVPMNIDGATAIIYGELGFAPTLGRGLFVLSRSVGALAHAWEESQSGLRNKGPIPRPHLPTYVGHAPRDLP